MKRWVRMVVVVAVLVILLQNKHYYCYYYYHPYPALYNPNPKLQVWVDAASQQTYSIVSGSPSSTMLGEVTKILDLERI